MSDTEFIILIVSSPIATYALTELIKRAAGWSGIVTGKAPLWTAVAIGAIVATLELWAVQTAPDLRGGLKLAVLTVVNAWISKKGHDATQGGV